ncbi:hypothetical protein [Paenibacillus segetis]|uniref:Uncharacterized protein n=1 Tax=Paenibacillus segetis TaxID=1325360 RepID=A0ABQ1YB21_9BACL|nr:hypothetical protein [Paenibacillus segetis]GGH18870.1 hypothetical protein GCM10008013_15140 [Paenibacillus segetis]
MLSSVSLLFWLWQNFENGKMLSIKQIRNSAGCIKLEVARNLDMNTKANTFMKVLLTCIYVIGVACVIYYSFMYIQHSTEIQNPEAMLPMMQYETGAWIMMLGMPFMIASCISMIWIFKLKKTLGRLWLLLPALIEIVVIASYWILER